MTWSSWQVNFLAWYPPAPLVLKVPEDAVSLVALPGQPVGTHLEYFQLGEFKDKCDDLLAFASLSFFPPLPSHSLLPLLPSTFSPFSPFFPPSLSLFISRSSLLVMISPGGQALFAGLFLPSFNTPRPCTYSFIGESCRFVTKLTSVSLRTTVKESCFLLSSVHVLCI